MHGSLSLLVRAAASGMLIPPLRVPVGQRVRAIAPILSLRAGLLPLTAAAAHRHSRAHESGRELDHFLDRSLRRRRGDPLMRGTLLPLFGFHNDLIDNLQAELFEEFNRLPSFSAWKEDGDDLSSTMRIGKGWSDDDLHAEISHDGRQLTVSGTRKSERMREHVESSMSLPFKVDDVNSIQLEYKGDKGLLVLRFPKALKGADEPKAVTSSEEKKQVKEADEKASAATAKATAKASAATAKSSTEVPVTKAQPEVSTRRVPITTSLPFPAGWREDGDSSRCTMRVGKGMKDGDLHAELSPDGMELSITGNWVSEDMKQSVQSSITLPARLQDPKKLILKYDAEEGTLTISMPKPETKASEPHRVPITFAAPKK